MKNWLFRSGRLLPLLALLWLLSGCTGQRLFRQPLQPLPAGYAPEVPAYEHVLRPDDKLTVSVWGHDDLGVGSSFAVPNANLEAGKYLQLDAKGDAVLPLLGKVHLAGLTLREADLYLSERYAKFLQEPIVKLRVLSHQVTVMGEVARPGNYPLDKQQTSLLEILGEAGGLTDYGAPRELQLLRRDAEQQWQTRYVDLTRIEALQPQALLLQPGDLVYVPPRPTKEYDKFATRLVPLAGILGSVVLLYSVLRSDSNP